MAEGIRNGTARGICKEYCENRRTSNKIVLEISK